MSAKLQRCYDGGRYYLLLGGGFLVLLGVLGGASRADELQQFFVRLAAIGVIAAALWPLNSLVFRDARAPALAVGLAYFLLLLQLIPVPPSIWARMPGHDIYALVAQTTNTIGWRPWSVSPDLTLNSVAALLPATAMGLVVLALDFRGRLILAKIVVAIACTSAVLGLMQWATNGALPTLFRTTSEGSAVGLFANRNHQAVLMACALPIVAALASIGTRGDGFATRHRAFAASVGILLLMALAATGSRMGLLLGFVGLTTALVIHLVTSRAPGHTAATKIRITGAGFAMAAILTLSFIVVRGGAIARLTSDPIDETRAAAFGPMLRTARAFLPFGAGFGTFDPVYRRFEPDGLLSTIYLNEAHNEPMQLAIEGGVPALLLLALFLAWWSYAVARAIRRKDSAERRALGAAMAAATFIPMLSSLVDYPLRTPLLSAVFAIGCVELLRSRRRTSPATRI